MVCLVEDDAVPADLVEAAEVLFLFVEGYCGVGGQDDGGVEENGVVDVFASAVEDERPVSSEPMDLVAPLGKQCDGA